MLIVGLGVAIEVLAKSWHAVFQGRERLALVSACLILQRTLTAVVGITVLLAGGGLLGAACVYLGGARGRPRRGRVLLPALDARAARPSRPAAGGIAMLRGGFTIGARRPAVRAAAEGRRAAAVVSGLQRRGRPLLGRLPADRGRAVRPVGVQRGDAAVARARAPGATLAARATCSA